MSDKTKILCKRIMAVITLILMLVAVEMMLGYALEPVHYSTYLNHDLEKIEKNGESVELVFVGPSRTLRSYIPSVFEETLGFNNVINGGSAAQRMIGSYYVLKDYIERFHPKYAVIGITKAGIYDGIKDIQNNLVVYDRLTLRNKIGYIFSYFWKHPAYLLKSYRYRNNLSDMQIIINDKKKVVEENYAPRTYEDDYYLDKGFVYNTGSMKTGNIEYINRGKFSRDSVDSATIKYLDKCVKLCEDNDIKLFIFTDVTTMMSVYGTENYQDVTDYLAEYAKSKGVPYFNVNYLKDRETLLPDELMMDDNHVNGEGAQIISEKIAQVIKNELEGIDSGDMFYDNVDELKATVNRIVSVKAKVTFDEENPTLAKVKMNCMRNEDIIPYYQLEISYDGENFDVLVPWSTDRKIHVEFPCTSGFILRVRAKGDSPDIGEAYYDYQF